MHLPINLTHGCPTGSLWPHAASKGFACSLQAPAQLLLLHLVAPAPANRRGLECLSCTHGKEGSWAAHTVGGQRMNLGEGGQLLGTGESGDKQSGYLCCGGRGCLCSMCGYESEGAELPELCMQWGGCWAAHLVGDNQGVPIYPL